MLQTLLHIEKLLLRWIPFQRIYHANWKKKPHLCSSITCKRIELESPCWSGFEAFWIVFKTWRQRWQQNAMAGAAAGVAVSIVVAAAMVVVSVGAAEVVVIIIANKTFLFLWIFPTAIAPFVRSKGVGDDGSGGNGGGGGGESVVASTVFMILNKPLPI